MRIPLLSGMIARRLLVNYRVDPEVAQSFLPPPFRPKVVHGSAIAGLCLIRLEHVRPRVFPSVFGFSSENAAHRFAAKWTDPNGIEKEGVFISRRDTSSRLNAIVGGRLFPGEHHHSRFEIEDGKDRIFIKMDNAADSTSLSVEARLSSKLPVTSRFPSMVEASGFFEKGSIGYSVTADPERFDGLELRCGRWAMEPMEVDHVKSSFFDDLKRFPRSSIDFDSALLMRQIPHEWHALTTLNSCGAAEMKSYAGAGMPEASRQQVAMGGASAS